VDREAILQENAEAQLLREADDRRFLYKDVEELIEVGFLSQAVRIEDSTVVLRTLLPSDRARFQARAVFLRSPKEVYRWSIATSVWMVNGFEVSADPKDNGAYHVHDEWVRHLPNAVVDTLSSIILGLNNRVSRAVRLTEAFCYERYSRALWRMRGRQEGGLDNANVVRRLWTAYNMTEDFDVEDDRAWSHTRAVVGSMSNKGAKYISQEIKKADEKEQNRRQRIIEEAVNWVIRGDEKKEPLKVVVGGKEVEVPQIHSAQSTEDLEEEMRRVFSGEKDFHDILVDRYQQSVRQRVLERREERQRMILEARRRSEEAEEQGLPPIVGYTREQLEQIRPGIVSKPRTTAALPASAQSNFMFDRYFSPDLKPGVLTPSLKVEDASAKDQARLGPQTEPKEGPTLQEKIAQRTPKLNEP
jgi:hypothetical protein